MRVLVTGAGGFIGRHVVTEALRWGYEVIALVRRDGAPFPTGVETRTSDLAAEDKVDLLGVDAIVHCAASLSGGADEQQRDTVLATQRLATAAQNAEIERAVLLSTFALYDMSALHAGAALDESCPLADVAGRHPYLAAKRRQEETMQTGLGDRLVVLRPGLVYGPGRTDFHQLGLRVGPLRVVLGGASLLPLVHVESCARAVVAALESPLPDTHLNLVDSSPPSRTQFVRALGEGPMVSVPWPLVSAGASVGSLINAPFGGRLPLPGVLRRAEIDERCKPLLYPNDAARRVLDWEPLSDFREGLATVA